MGFVVKKLRRLKNDRYELSLRADGTPNWQIVYENRKLCGSRARRETPVKLSQLESLGIDPKFTFDMAKERCRELNRESFERLGKGRAPLHSPFLPPILVREFEKRILLDAFSGDANILKANRFLTHWRFAKKMLAELKIDPKDYADERMQFYRHFAKKQISFAYVKKIVRVINAWGRFYLKSTKQNGFEPFPPPRGRAKLNICKARQEKAGRQTAAEPLSPTDLDTKSDHFREGHRNWLHLSIWLGLRPEEIDGLKDSLRWKLTRAEDGKTDVLWVYQTKLAASTEAELWKPIPLFHERQKECLEIIRSEEIRRPLIKQLRRAFPGRRIFTYFGRKGFVDLMLSNNQTIENISVWMGHMSIATTWKYYKQKQLVSFRYAKFLHCVLRSLFESYQDNALQ